MVAQPANDKNPKPDQPQANQVAIPNHIVVLQAINQLCALWAQAKACRVNTEQVMIMVEPIPGRPPIATPSGDVVMTFQFKMPPKVLGG